MPPFQAAPDLSVLTHGFHAPSATLFLEGEVSHAQASHLARCLHLFEFLKQPGTIYLTTMGGSRTASLGMYDLLRACRSQIRIIGHGDVSSAGILILQGADLRELMPNTRLLLHPGCAGIGQGLDSDVLSTAKEYIAERNAFYKLIGRRAGISLSDMLELYAKDVFLDARQAVKLGLADRISIGV